MKCGKEKMGSSISSCHFGGGSNQRLWYSFRTEYESINFRFFKFDGFKYVDELEFI